MPPAAGKDKAEVMGIFAPNKRVGAVGMAFMEAAAEMSVGVIDANTGEEMEQYLDKAALKRGELRTVVKL